MADNIKNNIRAKLPKIVKEIPTDASVISKLNKSFNGNQFNPINENIPAIAQDTYEKIKNNDSIWRLFPDTELCSQILISSIISPNDMINDKLNYKAPDIKMPTDVKSTLVKAIEEHLNKHYDLSSKLSIILKESLFTKGAYIEAIIPEASLDDLITQYDPTKNNVSLESYIDRYNASTGLFLSNNKNTDKITLTREEYKNTAINFETKNSIEVTQEDLGITITDNPNVLVLNKFLYKQANESAKRKLYKAKYSLAREHEDELNNLFRNNQNLKPLHYIEVKPIGDASRESVGKPLIFKLNTESVIPVHAVNDPSKHLGYFVLLDNNGSPINANEYEMDRNDILDTDGYGNDNKLNLVKKASVALFGMTKSDTKLENLENIYSQLVENMLINKLKNGMYGSLATIEENADIYRVMLYRSLRAQQTKILFLPSELVAYYAFDYRDNGTGKSLIEKASILYSVRAILFFTRMLASIKNSTTITEVNATLDEHDSDPNKTMEKVMSQVLATRRNSLPLGLFGTRDLADWAQRLGIKFKFSHPSLPALDITTSDASVSKIIPDDEFDKSIQEFIIMSFGLTPEIVQAGYAQDFATSVVAKNLLLAKRVTQIQKSWLPQIDDHIHKIMSNDMVIINTLKDLVKANIKEIRKTLSIDDDTNTDVDPKKISDKELIDYVTDTFISETTVYLPKPEVYEANSAKNAYEDYKERLESLADIVFDSTVFTAELVGEELSSKADMLKAIFKSMAVIKWTGDNNYLTELTEFTTKDDEGKPVFNLLEAYTSFMSSITEPLYPFFKDQAKLKGEIMKKLSKAQEDINSAGQDTSTSDSDSSTPTEDTSSDTNESTPEGEEPTGEEGEGGGDEEAGGGDEGDFDMDEGFGDESEGEEGSEPTDAEMVELEKKLKLAKIEREKAEAVKSKANAAMAAKKAGIDYEPDINHMDENMERNEENIENIGGDKNGEAEGDISMDQDSEMNSENTETNQEGEVEENEINEEEPATDETNEEEDQEDQNAPEANELPPLDEYEVEEEEPEEEKEEEEPEEKEPEPEPKEEEKEQPEEEPEPKEKSEPEEEEPEKEEESKEEPKQEEKKEEEPKKEEKEPKKEEKEEEVKEEKEEKEQEEKKDEEEEKEEEEKPKEDKRFTSKLFK